MSFSLVACSVNTDKNSSETEETEEKNDTVSQYEDEKYRYKSGRGTDNNKPDVFYFVSTVLLKSYDDKENETD